MLRGTKGSIWDSFLCAMRYIWDTAAETVFAVKTGIANDAFHQRHQRDSILIGEGLKYLQNFEAGAFFFSRSEPEDNISGVLKCA